MKQSLLFSLLLLFINLTNAQGWGQTQKIVPDDRESGDEFGWAVAMHGDYAVITAKDDDSPVQVGGSAYIFQNDGNGNWAQTQKLLAPNSQIFDRFGYSVAIDDQTIIVGARNHNFGGPNSTNTNELENSGAAYFFEKDGSGTWNFVYKAVAPIRATNDAFGESVAISGNYAVITAPTEDEDENDQNTIQLTGSAYVFEKDINGSWGFVQKIVASDRALDDRLGQSGSVSIDGDTIVISAEAEDEDENGLNTLNYAGSVYVFERNGAGVWDQTQKIVPSNRAIADAFGSDVAISGNFMIVGAHFRDVGNSDSGTACVFKKINGVWQELQQLLPSNSDSGYRFGRTVDIEGNRLVVGAYLEEVFGNSFAGTAYVYEKDINDFWNLQARIGALDADASDSFSFGLAISNDFVIAGAYREDEDINGGNTMSQSGSAYVFSANEPNTLSVQNTDINGVLKAYPNPVNSILNIKLNRYSETINLRVTNVLGQESLTKKYYNANEIQLDFQDQAKGLYVVEVRTNNQTVSVLKIVKQ